MPKPAENDSLATSRPEPASSYSQTKQDNQERDQQLMEWINTVIVPALVRRFLREKGLD